MDVHYDYSFHLNYHDHILAFSAQAGGCRHLCSLFRFPVPNNNHYNHPSIHPSIHPPVSEKSTTIPLANCNDPYVSVQCLQFIAIVFHTYRAFNVCVKSSMSRQSSGANWSGARERKPIASPRNEKHRKCQPNDGQSLVRAHFTSHHIRNPVQRT